MMIHSATVHLISQNALTNYFGSTNAEMEAPSKAAKVSLVVVDGGMVEPAPASWLDASSDKLASLHTVPVMLFNPLRNLAMVSPW